MEYRDWILDGLKIFIIVFVIGKTINLIFTRFQTKFGISRSKLFGIIHLLFIISFSYYLHNLTSDQFSEEIGITNPSVLFSGLFMGLQSNMFYNLGV
jgi:hypothetical protein